MPASELQHQFTEFIQSCNRAMSEASVSQYGRSRELESEMVDHPTPPEFTDTTQAMLEEE